MTQNCRLPWEKCLNYPDPEKALHSQSFSSGYTGTCTKLASSKLHSLRAVFFFCCTKTGRRGCPGARRAPRAPPRNSQPCELHLSNPRLRPRRAAGRGAPSAAELWETKAAGRGALQRLNLAFMRVRAWWKGSGPPVPKLIAQTGSFLCGGHLPADVPHLATAWGSHGFATEEKLRVQLTSQRTPWMANTLAMP